MPDETKFPEDLPATAEVRLLGEDGQWEKIQPARTAADWRRMWIDLSEGLRTFGTAQEDFKGTLWTLIILPLDWDLKQALLDTIGQALLDAAYRPDEARENWARAIALVLEGQPEFHTGRFMRHATSDSPDDSGAYNRENPDEALKVTIEPA